MNDTPRYLYPVRKRLEIVAAVFSFGFGLHVWALSFHSQPLLWAGMENGDALMFGQVMSLAGLIHGLGIRINGHWRWSPALRAIGMMIHALCFAWLAFKGTGTTAGYTYSWGVGLTAMGMWSAGRDLSRNWEAGDTWTQN